MRRINKKLVGQIALQRIGALFAFAKVFSSRGDRYVYLARKISMKANVPIPKLYKRRFCKHCYSYFTSKNSRVRTRNGRLVVSCLSCGKFYRRPLNPKPK